MQVNIMGRSQKFFKSVLMAESCHFVALWLIFVIRHRTKYWLGVRTAFERFVKLCQAPPAVSSNNDPNLKSTCKQMPPTSTAQPDQLDQLMSITVDCILDELGAFQACLNLGILSTISELVLKQIMVYFPKADERQQEFALVQLNVQHGCRITMAMLNVLAGRKQQTRTGNHLKSSVAEIILLSSGSNGQIRYFDQWMTSSRFLMCTYIWAGHLLGAAARMSWMPAQAKYFAPLQK